MSVNGFIKSFLMSYTEIHCSSHEDWLLKRVNGIGASECSSIIGRNPYKTNLELYNEKVGIAIKEDISSKPQVIYGKNAEKHIRALFALKHSEYEVIDPDDEHPTILQSQYYPFIICTLDGILIEKKSGKKGVLEVKTSEIISSQHKESWKDGKVPENYFCQVLHQLYVTGFDFAILVAELRFEKTLDNGEKEYWSAIREYRFERTDYIEDIKILIKEEIIFWKNYVEKGIEPPLKLNLNI